jgi:hypothetical protein
MDTELKSLQYIHDFLENFSKPLEQRLKKQENKEMKGGDSDVSDNTKRV